MNISTKSKAIVMGWPDPVLPFAKVLEKSGIVNSLSDGIRLINAQSVSIDGEILVDVPTQVVRGATHHIQIGKRRGVVITII